MIGLIVLAVVFAVVVYWAATKLADDLDEQ